jgi:catechol 2,3-dioxygenase-like lactoylglutathione lyase family enzyme
MLTRMDRVVIAVRDIRRAQQEAISVLGLTPAWVGGYPGDQTEAVLFRLENVCIELLSPAPDADSPAANRLAAKLDEKGDGLFAIVFESDHIDDDTAGLAERGMTPSPASDGLSKDEPSGAYRRFRESWLPLDQTAGIRLGLIHYSSLREELPPSLATGEEAATVESGDHVVVMTSAPERILDLYREKLGIRLALDKTFEKRGVRLIFFRLGDFTIEIGCRFDPKADETPDKKTPAPTPVPDDHLWGLAFKVPDADAARQRILKTDLDVSEVRKGNKPGTRVCTVRGEPMGVPTLIIDSK